MRMTDYIGYYVAVPGVGVNTVFKNKSYFCSFVIYHLDFLVSCYQPNVLDTE